MLKIVALVVLLITVLGLAHTIEMSARPPTNREGVHVEGSHAH
jgi:hypothetical protein